MGRELSSAQRAELDSQGATISGDIGGVKKQRYYTPDGREVLAVPSMKNWVRREGKKVLDSGIRDANLDNGWLLQPPTKLKLHCDYCDRWHDTQKEIDACGAKKKVFDDKWAEKVKKLRHKDDGDLRDEVSELKSDMSDIKSMLSQLLKGK